VQRELEASPTGDKASAWKEYTSLASGQSNANARIAAHRVLGKHISWDWDRTWFYHIITPATSPPQLMVLDSSEDERGILSHHGRIRGSSTPVFAPLFHNCFSQSAIKRLLAYAPYADLLWFETNTPSVEAAARVARTIRAQYPGKRVSSLVPPSYFVLMLRLCCAGSWCIT
jgi:isocitrate/methylisocitrate lyase